MQLVDETLVVFVVSTTGNGEFPAPARPFWQFLLRRALPEDILSDVAFATFGLGDSTYARYCWSSRMLNRRLQGLGAHQIVPSGEADDQHYAGIDGGLQPWLEELWRTLDAELEPLPAGLEPIPDDQLLPPRIYAHLTADAPAPASELSLDEDQCMARLTTNRRITAEDHFQDVRFVELQLPDTQPLPAYRPGDVVAVHPENRAEDVDHLLERMGLTGVADTPVSLENRDRHRPLPEEMQREMERRTLTLRRLLTRYLDPFAVPRRTFFETICHFSPHDHMEHEKLAEYLQPGDGTLDMYEYAQRVRRTASEVLDEFKSVQVPPEYVAELFPLMRERQFSIASGPTTHPRTLQLLVAIVRYRTRLRKPREGVCSSWLARLEPGALLPVRLQPGTLTVPATANTPVVAVGPGTGIAPLRSIVQERIAAKTPASDTLVFLGCRYLAKDCLLRDEWEQLARNRRGAHSDAAADADEALGALTLADKPGVLLWIAASRDQEGRKVYVQDRLREQGAQVWDTLGPQRGILYICGNSGRMPEQVREAVRDIVAEHGEMDTDQATRFLQRLEAERRLQEETW